MRRDPKAVSSVERNWALMLYCGRRSYPCLVRNFCNSGAKVEDVPAAVIPERVMLQLTPHGHRRQCRVVWRSDDKIGVEFLEHFPRLPGGDRRAGRPCSAACTVMI